ncbi:hypothetical protein BaOVIS_033220 [Babesia ovis]|uniref:Macro domain-containing protein n=1 Tax=Babesia ovis TaxID=5869 RepID=A0A9W5WWE9_BABOV|nr:hypothetical protein BaOVIS_033220 [Babesia ovis]
MICNLVATQSSQMGLLCKVTYPCWNTGLYRCSISWMRGFATGSFLQSRLKTIRERSISQQLDWSDTVNPNGAYDRALPAAGFADVCREPFEAPHDSSMHKTNLVPNDLLTDGTSGYLGPLEVLEIDAYGTISAEHDNILEMEADGIVVPVPHNLTPYSGLGLKVLERGGKKLITALVKRAKVVVAERVKAIEDMQSHFNSKVEYENALKDSKSLKIGDVIFTPPFGATKTTVIGFVVTPFFFENSSRDAMLKVRHVFKHALEQMNRVSIRTILCPSLGDVVNGYEPPQAIHAMVEEAYDVLTQVDALKPSYGIRHVRLVHKRLPEARKIAKAVVEVAHERRPEFQVVLDVTKPTQLQVQPAAMYYSRATQRLIEFDESVLKFCSRPSKITYKRHSVVRKSKRMHWIRNIKPYVWRSGRFYSPPPLLVYKSTGLPTANQLPPRPFYKDRVSHVLFPLERKPIKGLRIRRSGKLVGEVKPRPIYMQRVEL